MIPEHVIEAVIEAESGGNPRAESSAGAQGLMQLMPATGKEWHANLKIQAEYLPFDAKQNREIGTAYLNHLFNRYKDLELALAAYNWGMGNLDRVLHNLDAKTFAQVYNSVPKETQRYVSRIMQRVREYEQA